MTEISMRERIAERLMQHYAEGGPWDGFMEADIVLAVLAEPTAAMAKHVADNAEHVSSPAHRSVLAHGWSRVFTAMIRAAQEGK